MAQGQYCYAFCLMEGIGGPRDKPAAIEWLERAGENGNTSAMQLLGESYLTGKYTVSDPALGFRLLLEAAKRGEGAAMDKVGCCYMTGHGVRPNFTEARKWFERAISKNYHQAHLNLTKLKELEEKTPKTHGKRRVLSIVVNNHWCRGSRRKSKYYQQLQTTRVLHGTRTRRVIKRDARSCICS